MKSKNLLLRVLKHVSGLSHRGTLAVLAILALLVVLFTTALPALAANQVVSDCGDNGGANQLRAKLAAAQSSGGGTITFTCAGPIALNSALSINSNITVEGGSGMTLSGGNAIRIFIVTSGSLTLNNLTVTKGYAAGDGGAISASATLNINNSHLLDNHTATGYAGGAIRTTGALNIANSEFGSNSATNGGALFVKWGGGIVTITGSNFHDNHTPDMSEGEGGAVMLFDGAAATVSNSTFTSNTAKYGGVFFIDQPTTNPTTLTMSNSTLSSNQTGESGGAIYNGGTLTLAGGTLSQNTGHSAGALSNFGAASLTNVTLTGNHADTYGGGTSGVGSGGGIVNYENSTLTLTGVTLSNNSADSMGGALYNEGTLTANTSTFSTNTAYYGGGIYNDTNATALTLTATTLDHNGAIAGGGIYNADTIALTNVTLSSNTATAGGSGGQSGDGTGGGMFNNGGATLLNVTFKGNSSNGGGEAINDYSPGTLTLTNSLVAKAGATNDSCKGNLSGSYNYADDSSCNFGSGHIVADLKLGPLANNGGTTKTHLPAAASAAIDNGTGLNCPATDQRGITRPQGLACDVGAIEVQPATPTPTKTLTRTPTRTPTRTATQTLTRTATPTATLATCAGKPAKPVLVKPKNGRKGGGPAVKLDWNDAACASSYQVLVKTGAQNGPKAFGAKKLNVSQATTGPLVSGQTYFWRVAAINANGKAKSDWWSFKVK